LKVGLIEFNDMVAPGFVIRSRHDYGVGHPIVGNPERRGHEKYQSCHRRRRRRHPHESATTVATDAGIYVRGGL
jgi:hypothetical protein